MIQLRMVLNHLVGLGSTSISKCDLMIQLRMLLNHLVAKEKWACTHNAQNPTIGMQALDLEVRPCLNCDLMIQVGLVLNHLVGLGSTDMSELRSNDPGQNVFEPPRSFEEGGYDPPCVGTF